MTVKPDLETELQHVVTIIAMLMHRAKIQRVNPDVHVIVVTSGVGFHARTKTNVLLVPINVILMLRVITL